MSVAEHASLDGERFAVQRLGARWLLAFGEQVRERREPSRALARDLGRMASDRRHPLVEQRVGLAPLIRAMQRERETVYGVDRARVLVARHRSPHGEGLAPQ